MNILVSNCKNEFLIFFKNKFNQICFIVMVLLSIILCGWMKVEEQRFPDDLKGNLASKVNLVYSLYDGFQYDLRVFGDRNVDFDVVRDYYYEYSYFFGDLFFRDLSEEEILQDIIDLLNQEQKVDHVEMLMGVRLSMEERRMWLDHIITLKENGLMVIDEQHHFSSYNGMVQLHKQGLIVLWFVGLGIMLIQMLLKDKQNHVERIIYTSPHPRKVFIISKLIANSLASFIVLFGFLGLNFLLYGMVSGFENQEYLLYTINGHVRLDQMLLRCLFLDIGSVLLLNLLITSLSVFIKDMKKGLVALLLLMIGLWILANFLPFTNALQLFLPYKIASEGYHLIGLLSCIFGLMFILLFFIFCCYQFEKKDLY